LGKQITRRREKRGKCEEKGGQTKDKRKNVKRAKAKKGA
jgi:hypothetical protein